MMYGLVSFDTTYCVTRKSTRSAMYSSINKTLFDFIKYTNLLGPLPHPVDKLQLPIGVL